ncbi:hypothetical protein [Bacillus pumilus]|uniref:hypothetical protein n=1 Tax=Bacillus pumilus TaxID=1408 RepID=UPI002281D46F|nr:hypothetical protein [Bacillus pumilus]MCY7500118.1 hypothetical protein [Bacillus pumilus]MCY7528558.1 hypothetical protein [Bacillus pumilus]MED4439483.1 hypothetical protein [Bacillus pumilus]MED4489926.1 hypothetical protein [Bacillus pumilus]
MKIYFTDNKNIQKFNENGEAKFYTTPKEGDYAIMVDETTGVLSTDIEGRDCIIFNHPSLNGHLLTAYGSDTAQQELVDVKEGKSGAMMLRDVITDEMLHMGFANYKPLEIDLKEFEVKENETSLNSKSFRIRKR